MIDITAIALLALGALLGPQGAEEILIDLLDPQSGQVMTMTAERALLGYTLKTPQGEGSIEAGEGGHFIVKLPGAANPISVELKPILEGLQAQKGEGDFLLHGEKIRISKSRGARYITRLENPGILITRAAPRAALLPFATPTFRATPIPEFAGWSQYTESWRVDRQQAQAGLAPGRGSPAAAAAHFYASVMRGDARYLEVLSPHFKPALRAQLEALVKAKKGSEITWVRGDAEIRKELALKLEQKPLKGMAQAFIDIFGDFDVLMFGEEISSRFDVFMIFEEIKGEWYIKGLGSHILRLEPPKEPAGQ